jgi:hypothetical protein
MMKMLEVAGTQAFTGESKFPTEMSERALARYESESEVHDWSLFMRSW